MGHIVAVCLSLTPVCIHVCTCVCTPCVHMCMYTLCAHVYVHPVCTCVCTPCVHMCMYTLCAHVYVHPVCTCVCTPCVHMCMYTLYAHVLTPVCTCSGWMKWQQLELISIPSTLRPPVSQIHPPCTTTVIISPFVIQWQLVV